MLKVCLKNAVVSILLFSTKKNLKVFVRMQKQRKADKNVNVRFSFNFFYCKKTFNGFASLKVWFWFAALQNYFVYTE